MFSHLHLDHFWISGGWYWGECQPQLLFASKPFKSARSWASAQRPWRWNITPAGSTTRPAKGEICWWQHVSLPSFSLICLTFWLHPYLLTCVVVGTTWRLRAITLGSIACQPPSSSSSMISSEVLSNDCDAKSIYVLHMANDKLSLFQTCFEGALSHVLSFLPPSPSSTASPFSRFFCTPSRWSIKSKSNYICTMDSGHVIY